MRVLQHALEVMHRHHGDVGLDQQVGPFGGGAGFENAREFGIDGVDIDGASGKRRKPGIAAQIVASGRRKEIFPLLVVVDDHADVAIGGLVRPPVARQVPRIAALVERRLVGQAAHVVAHHKTRHGLEHRNVDALATPGAVAMHQAGADRTDSSQTHDAVDQRIRHIARHAVAGLRHQRGKRGGALDQIVISGLCRIGAVLTETEHAGIDQPRIDFRNHVVAELQPRHRLRPHVVDQHVGGRDQPQHGVAPGRLLQIEADRALAAVGVEEHRPHAGMPGRPDLPRHVAIRCLDLDDVGAVVAEHLGGIGPHQHGRHVDDLDALEWSHGVVCSRCAAFVRCCSRPSNGSGREEQGRQGMGVCVKSIPVALRSAGSLIVT